MPTKASWTTSWARAGVARDAVGESVHESLVAVIELPDGRAFTASRLIEQRLIGRLERGRLARAGAGLGLAHAWYACQRLVWFIRAEKRERGPGNVCLDLGGRTVRVDHPPAGRIRARQLRG